MASIKPSKLNIRAYQVGFGDCFLLSFYYPKAAKPADQERHMLIDFGSTGMPKEVEKAGEQMMKVALDIQEKCRGKLDIVVATHRHKDHISGFTTNEDGTGTGDIIASLKPTMVIQPWTEDPKAKDPKVVAPAKKSAAKGGAKDSGQELAATYRLHVASLQAMNQVAESMLQEVAHLNSGKFKQAMNAKVSDQIEFLAEDNKLPNKSAVANLAKMGKNYYVSFDYKLNTAKILPEVKITVLGPPTLEQHAEIQKQRSADKDEFWMLQGAAQQFWGLQAATSELLTDFSANKGRLFPDAPAHSRDSFPPHYRWFIRQIRAMRGEQMLGLVRILDKAMNNTSVILLIEVGGKKLLFPGDAQIENWEYSLQKEAIMKLLEDVDVYKVGHHGSRNATPKTLWKNFGKKSKNEKATNRLSSVISTMKGKHGTTEATKVPRQTLVDALSEFSDYHTTQTAAQKGELYIDMEIKFTQK